MLPIGSRQGRGGAAPTPAPPLSDIVPPQAMAYGGTIIRPGAVAWGGTPRTRGCEAIERALAAVAADPSGLPGLLAELATARLWVPLPATPRPFTDGAAVRLPLVTFRGTDFVPCFTSVLRLSAWAGGAAETARTAEGVVTEAGDAGAAERPWQRASDRPAVPHIVVPAVGLAGRLPPDVGLAFNPGSAPSLPLYPECVAPVAELATTERAAADVVNDWVACNTSRLYTRE
jgi:SseB protein N-terminal domain